MVSKSGKQTMPAAIRCELVLLKSVSTRDRYLANARHTNTLHNSAGCKLNPPSLMIDSVPLILVWKGNTNSNSRMPNAYQILAVAVKNLLSVSRINNPINNDTAKKINCLL